jgi:hypothetical protein
MKFSKLRNLLVIKVVILVISFVIYKICAKRKIDYGAYEDEMFI